MTIYTAVDGWAIIFWYRPLLAVPNVTAHLLTASVPTFVTASAVRVAPYKFSYLLTYFF